MSERVAAPGQAVLKILAEDGGRREFEMRDQEILVGRAADSQLVLESTTVSRHHARLVRDAFDNWQIHDLDSRNGTLLNGRPIKEQALRHGDQIQIGSFTLQLHRPPSSAALRHPMGHAVIAERPNLHFSEDSGRLSTLNDLEPPRVSAAHLSTLNQLTQQLLLTADPEERALQLCRLMVSPQFHGEWAVMLSLPIGGTPGSATSSAAAPGDEIAPRMLCEPQHAPSPRQALHVSRSLLRAVAAQDQAILASNVKSSATPAEVEMSIAPGVMSLAAVACPIERHAHAQDLLYVTLPPQYGTGEWLALSSLAAQQYQHAEMAWAARTRDAAHAAFARELEQARQIQLRLIPRPAALAAFKNQRLDLAIGFSPSRFVGGDYVDALMMADGRVLLVLADVCGHGLGAALLTSVVHTLVRSAVRRGATVAEIVQGLNQHLCETLPGDSFVTLVALALSTADGSMEYINAGHPPPFAINPQGDARQFHAGQNLPLGIDSSPLEMQSEQLASGELLAIYSDGLNEQTAPDGPMLGISALKQKVQEICSEGADPQTVAEALTEFLADHRGQRALDDDQSFLLARRV